MEIVIFPAKLCKYIQHITYNIYITLKEIVQKKKIPLIENIMYSHLENNAHKQSM